MGGDNCAFPSCHTERSRCKGLSYFSLPKIGGKHAEWRRKLIAKINRTDAQFLTAIRTDNNNVRICSRHFTESCIKTFPSGACRLLPGSLPTEWMPSKSVETPKLAPRKPPLSREAPTVPERVAYHNFDEVKADILGMEPGLLPSSWCVLEVCGEHEHEHITLGKADESKTFIELKIKISADLTIAAFVFGMHVTNFTDTIDTTKVRRYLADLSCRKICPGVTDAELQSCADLHDPAVNQLYFRQAARECVRSAKCLLFASDLRCPECRKTRQLLMKKRARAHASVQRPLSKYDPMHSTSKRVTAHIKQNRKQVKLLQKEIEELRKFKDSIDSDSIQVNDELSDSLAAVVEKAGDDNKLAKLFWEEQVKAFGAKKHGMKWHPMLIRIAILIQSRSPLAYDTLRNTGILKLPGKSTLRDYTNAIQPTVGFSASAIEELNRLSKDLKDHERYIVLLHDEMSIKADLVFDKRSGEVVGFVNSNRWLTDNYVTSSSLAKHVLCFFVVGVNTHIRVSLGFFGTANATAADIYPLFWQAVGHLEMQCGLKVIASVSDKASPNQKLYQLHKTQDGELCYKTENLFAADRFIYFISDPPHLIKTVRNNLSNSGSGRNTQRLWCRDKEILWKHVRQLYELDCRTETRCTKLTADHVNLTTSSVMNVRLAAQVLSFSVGTMMRRHLGEETEETVQLILKMNRLFGCLNVRSLEGGKRRRNPDLSPYTSVDDPRFVFLQEFLGYLENWKRSIAQRPGNFTTVERNRMFLTHQTYKGLVMTVHAFVEATKFLLNNGVPHVLSNVFCQDPLENHFGRHRGMGRRSENPSLHTFGYQDNEMLVQRGLALRVTPNGNVKRDCAGDVPISISPLKKIRRG